jgi:hypothetical protein
MCSALSVQYREFTDQLIEFHKLQDHVVTRNDGAEKEIRFQYRDKKALLPAWHGSVLDIYEWGNRDSKTSKLPHTGWCRRESLEEGKWKWLKPELVDIPAAMICEKGVWLQVPEGIKGVMVLDEQKKPHVYVLTEPASHYFEVATRHNRMPVMIGAKI